MPADTNRAPNRLIGERSPYLLQHAHNPVDWWPWSEEAFQKAKTEDKPVFLSIGYSACHWCHVMARESFEDEEIARLLNRDFVSVKVDKEERPDIDSVYQAACQEFTGGSGWPATIFMTPEQKPFFAGTYFPKTAWGGMIGLKELLTAVHEEWESDRAALSASADRITALLRRAEAARTNPLQAGADRELIESAVAFYKGRYDERFGGFGEAPKFPAPHIPLFLLTYYEKSGDRETLAMAETTLLQMYRGGLFDHIGGGFCRYSTDRYFLVPHFEKMLYDNALLILAYCKAYRVTKKTFYRDVAEKTARYVLREMTSPDGGFYSAEDADSEGKEGKYYVLTPREILGVLGPETGEAFCRHYNITEKGNFDGKSIPNLLQSDPFCAEFDSCLPMVYDYRRGRHALRLDDKILASWNSLMIAALCHLYRAAGDESYLAAAKEAQRFLEKNLCQGDALFVSFRAGGRGEPGFLDDYADYVFALLALHGATLEPSFLEKARHFCKRAVAGFYDAERGGFYLYARGGEPLIARPKETYDGAAPSGNSMMAYDLARLSLLDEGGESDMGGDPAPEGKSSPVGKTAGESASAGKRPGGPVPGGDFAPDGGPAGKAAPAEKRFEGPAPGGDFAPGREITPDGGPAGKSAPGEELTEKTVLKRQMAFLSAQAGGYPAGYAMFLTALSEYLEPPQTIVAVPKDPADLKELPFIVPPESAVRVFCAPTKEYPLKDGRTTFYVCQNRRCLPPVHDLRRME
ncbi:MAG TPA: DUF255 domain-containing protein [Oscillospiraceae bacterium]|nr:DUF255 domain-containing protein [Oscillospiraceae bacterium]HNW04504.1 DUF255 domain-containing protein [Oscillospiraceae bacterium]